MVPLLITLSMVPLPLLRVRLPPQGQGSARASRSPPEAASAAQRLQWHAKDLRAWMSAC